MLILLFKTHTVYWLSQRLLLISLPSFLQVFYLWYLLYLLIHILFFLGMRGQREEGERGGSTLPLGKTPEAPVLVSNWWTEKMWGICGEKSTFSPRFINTLATKCPPQHFIKKFPNNPHKFPSNHQILFISPMDKSTFCQWAHILSTYSLMPRLGFVKINDVGKILIILI